MKSESQRIVPKNENLKLLDALDFYASLNPLMFHNAVFSNVYLVTQSMKKSRDSHLIVSF